MLSFRLALSNDSNSLHRYSGKTRHCLKNFSFSSWLGRLGYLTNKELDTCGPSCGACWQQNEAELEKGQTRWREGRSQPSAVLKIRSTLPHRLNPAVPVLGQMRSQTLHLAAVGAELADVLCCFAPCFANGIIAATTTSNNLSLHIGT
jgi:hypothetical protein